MSYNHTQIGYVIIVSSALTFLPAFMVWTALGLHWILWLAVAIPPLIILLFGSLNIRIDQHALTIRFGMGLIRKRFPLNQISSNQPVTNKFYYGWGIRYTPHGWLYNVSGTSAVQLQMTNGKKVRIGTDEPQRLNQALNQALPSQR